MLKDGKLDEKNKVKIKKNKGREILHEKKINKKGEITKLKSEKNREKRRIMKEREEEKSDDIL